MFSDFIMCNETISQNKILNTTWLWAAVKYGATGSITIIFFQTTTQWNTCVE